ncbi:HNH endonuclease [Burkholderia sp. AW33-5]
MNLIRALKAEGFEVTATTRSPYGPRKTLCITWRGVHVGKMHEDLWSRKKSPYACLYCFPDDSKSLSVAHAPQGFDKNEFSQQHGCNPDLLDVNRNDGKSYLWVKDEATSLLLMRDWARRIDEKIRNDSRTSSEEPPESHQNRRESDWSMPELRASVAAYLDMARRFRHGQPVVKKQVYRDLSAKTGRSEESCEFRMRNISHVLALMGRDWIPGLPPAKNVGVRVTEQIETLICELESRRESARATEAATVAKLRKTLKQRPAGSKTPQKTTSTTTSIVRDPQVKAWVLERANGTCEACDQPAPFIGADGFPFLEVHHLRRLADDGSDTPENAVAVCPNCHRRLHFSENARAYRETLYGKVSDLVRE